MHLLGDRVDEPVFSDRPMTGTLEAAFGPCGAVHVIYAEADASGQAAMMYRRGYLVGPRERRISYFPPASRAT